MNKIIRIGCLRTIIKTYLDMNNNVNKYLLPEDFPYRSIKEKSRLFISIIFAMVILRTVAFAEVIDVESGTYYQLGKYNDKPIIWRAIIDEDDENGILMVSDKLLCFKSANAGKNDDDINPWKNYGSSSWEESTTRQWLNSTNGEGEILWNLYRPDKEHLIRHRMKITLILVIG